MPACDRRADGQTDGQTHDESIYLASIALRGKNYSFSCRTTENLVKLALDLPDAL